MKLAFIILLLFFSKIIFGRTISLTPAAVVIKLRGEALRKHQHQKIFHKIFLKDPIFVGDTLKTKSSTTLRIKQVDDSILTIGPKSELIIQSFGKKFKKKSLISLLKGQIRAWVREKSKDQKDVFKITTNDISIGVRGTDFLTNSYLVNGKETTDILLLEGGIKGNFASNKSFSFKPGEYINSNYLDQGPKKIDKETLKALLDNKESLFPKLLDKEGKLKNPSTLVEDLYVDLDNKEDSESINVNIHKSTTTTGKEGQKNSNEINIDYP